MNTVSESNLSVSVILPCFNEEENIKDVIDDAVLYLQKYHEAEIIVVDDGSCDKTYQILQKLISVCPVLKVIRFNKNYGLSAALVAGCKKASGDIVVTMDADRQYRANSIDRLLEDFNGDNVVCGYRLMRSDQLTKKISSFAGNIFGDWITGDKVRDSGCLVRMFPKKVISDITFFDGFHRFFPTLCRIKGYDVCEVGVEHYPRIKGASKFNIRNRIFAALFDAFAVRRLLKRKIGYVIDEES